MSQALAISWLACGPRDQVADSIRLESGRSDRRFLLITAVLGHAARPPSIPLPCTMHVCRTGWPTLTPPTTLISKPPSGRHSNVCPFPPTLFDAARLPLACNEPMPVGFDRRATRRGRRRSLPRRRRRTRCAVVVMVSAGEQGGAAVQRRMQAMLRPGGETSGDRSMSKCRKQWVCRSGGYLDAVT